MDVYTVRGGQSTAASGTETAVRLTAPANRIAKVRRIRVSQATHTTSEQYTLAVKRASAAGSGGSARTPVPIQANGGAAGTSAESGPTTEPTYTGDPIVEAYWNSLVGRDIILGEGSEIVIPPSGHLGIYVVAPAGATTFTPNVEVELAEEG